MKLLPLKQHLLSGLRSDSRFERNRPSLVDCIFTKVTPFGIRPHEVITQAISDNNLLTGQITNGHADITKAFPFPHIIRGKGVTLLMDELYIYEVDESDWTLTALTTWEYDDHTTAYNADTFLLPNADGNPWQFADMHDSWFVFNGSGQCAFKTKWLNAAKVLVSDDVSVRTGCTFRGRMIMGGFEEADFWLAGHDALWAAIIDTNFTAWGLDPPDLTDNAPKKNWVWWSVIGGGDILGFFNATLWAQGLEGIGTDDGYSSTVPFFLDSLRACQSGFMPMDFQGAVLKVLPLGNNVMVYGEDGISAITPSSSPVPTFGLREGILRIGVPKASMVGGSDKRHVFLDVNYTLWTIDAELQLTRLGYEEYFQNWNTVPPTLSEWQISYDHEYDEFYISNNAYCYVLTQAGLSEYPWAVYSIVKRQAVVAGAPTYITRSLLGITATDGVNSNDECIQNGTFTGASTGWALGTNMAYAGNEIVLSVQGDGTEFLAQTLVNMLNPIHVGGVYEVVFTCTISNPGAGVYIQALVGNTGLGTQRTAGATYTETILCSDAAPPPTAFQLKVVEADGTIDDVSLVPKGCYIRTGWMSSEDGDLLTIKAVRVVADDYSNISVALDYVPDVRDGLSDFNTTDFVSVDGRGFANIPVTAFDYRVIIMSTDFSDTNIDDVFVVFADEKTALKAALT